MKDADDNWIDCLYFNPNPAVALVPTMTSNTTPSGECISSSVASGKEPYLAFDGNDSTFANQNSEINSYIGYNFGTRVKVSAVDYHCASTSRTVKIVASNDRVNWVTLKSGISISQEEGIKRINLDTYTGTYSYYAIMNDTSSAAYCSAYTIQFYGWR